jgi:hypothetical protein
MIVEPENEQVLFLFVPIGAVALEHQSGKGEARCHHGDFRVFVTDEFIVLRNPFNFGETVISGGVHELKAPTGKEITQRYDEGDWLIYGKVMVCARDGND